MEAPLAEQQRQMPHWFDCFVRLALYDEREKGCNTTRSVVNSKSRRESVKKEGIFSSTPLMEK